MTWLALAPIGRLDLILSVQSLQVAPESTFTKLEMKEIAPTLILLIHSIAMALFQ